MPDWSPHRRAVLHGLAGAALAQSARAAASADASGTFIAIGDWGRDGLMHQSDVAAAMARAASEIGSRFVISTGDNFYPAGVKSISDPQWKTSFEDVYAAPALQTPWHVALGNHDYRGSALAQMAYSRVSARWQMPSPYFRKAATETGIPDLEIFYLDTTPLAGGWGEKLEDMAHGRQPPHESRKQIAWLSESLSRSSAAWKVVVGHHPIYSGGRHGDTPGLVETIQPILKAHGVQAYLNGHDHALQHIRRGDIDYICSGSGASAGSARAVEGTRFRSSRAGFAMFSLASESLDLEFRDFTGATLYQASLPRARG